MKNNIRLSFMMISFIILISGCFESGGGGSEVTTTPSSSPVAEDPAFVGNLDCNGVLGGAAYLDNNGVCVDVYHRTEILEHITGNTYHLSSMIGDDITGDGTEDLPWQTLTKVQSMVQPGDGVILQTGNYGTYSETDILRDSYITYIAEEDSDVTFTNISIFNTASTDNYLIFYGINIEPEWVDPASSGNIGADDPQYAESVQSTYAKTRIPVELSNVNYIQVVDCNLVGTSRHLTPYGVWLSGSTYITIEHCNIEKVTGGIVYIGSSQLLFKNNHIHEIGVSAFKDGLGVCTHILIEGNHAHNCNVDYSEDYAPRALNANYHASAVAIRSGGDITIRRNIFHDGFNSSAIMTYSTGNGYHYDNVNIEGNLIYDIHTTSLIRLYQIGDNCTINNNTIIGQSRVSGDGRWKFNIGISVSSLDIDGTPHVGIYNNIVIGMLGVTTFMSNVTENNNILWSYLDDGLFYCENDVEIGDNDIIMTCLYANEPVSELDDLFSGISILYTPEHAQLMDFSIQDGSIAINLGDSGIQSGTSLGTLDNAGFILDNGTLRTLTEHSAGAYEGPQFD